MKFEYHASPGCARSIIVGRIPESSSVRVGRRSRRGGMVVSIKSWTRKKVGLAVASFGLFVLAAGCEEPTLIPAAAPGDDAREVQANKLKEKDDPQANGEVAGTTEHKPTALPDVVPATPTAKGETKTTKSGVKYTTLKEGTGAVARSGQTVSVHYVGTLDDGREFDNSRKRGKPAEFLIGVGNVIRGWDEGVPGMKIGEIRKLDIPAAAGYGAQGKGPVPQNANLHFEVELMDVR